MRVFLKDVCVFSRVMRGILETQGIKQVEDLQRFVESKIVLPVPNTRDYWIAFDSRKSNGETEAYAVSYTRTGPFTPLQVRVNQNLGYSQILVKSQEPIPGYNVLDRDHIENFSLAKRIPGIDIALIKKALESLELPLAV